MDISSDVHVEVIKQALRGYPFGLGIFREILQNSDDALASKQVFLLDTRDHEKQGPALIAYNDSIFTQEDWTAIRGIYKSTKKVDTSKIGKFGLGFRAVYHITDYPQILSGRSFGVFDQNSDHGWATQDVSNLSDAQKSSLNFDWFQDSREFTGTIIRLPLRTMRSAISDTIISSSGVRKLMDKFVQDELALVLLFLPNLKDVEVCTIGEGDISPRSIASVTSSYGSSEVTGQYETSVRTTTVTPSNGPITSQDWRVLHGKFNKKECAELISARLHRDVYPIMAKEKMTPEIGLAFPLSPPSNSVLEQRLFTYLPLPIHPGLPCHVHGLFALDPTRQHLQNHQEDLAVGSDDELRVEWNRFLFDTLIPRAWASLLAVLVREDDERLGDIYNAWPPQSTDESYWQCVPRKVLKEIISANKVVWPTLSGASPNRHINLSKALIAKPDFSPEYSEQLVSLTIAGVLIVQPPPHLYESMKENAKVQVLTPTSARQGLLQTNATLLTLAPTERYSILSYLSSAGDLNALLDLPLIPLINGTFTRLSLRSAASEVHILLDPISQPIFDAFDPSAVTLKELPTPASKVLLAATKGSYNVKNLSPDVVLSYIRLAYQNFDLSCSTVHESHVANNMIEWFANFWRWAAAWEERRSLYPLLRTYPLLPTSQDGLVYWQNGIFDAVGCSLFPLLRLAGVPFLHHSLENSQSVPRFFWEHGTIRSFSNIPQLLEHLRPDKLSSFNEVELEQIRKHLVKFSSRLTREFKTKLRRLPIFPRLLAGQPTPQVTVEPILDGFVIKCITGDEVLPIIANVFYTTDLRSARLIDAETTVLSKVEILQLAIDHFLLQPIELQLKFLKRIQTLQSDIPQSTLAVLSHRPFVLAVNGDLCAPADLLDPRSFVAELLLPEDHRLPAESNEGNKEIVHAMSSLRLFNTEFTLALARDRIECVATGAQHGWALPLAEKLLQAMEGSDLDFQALGDKINLSWLPTTDGLCSPDKCRGKDDESFCKDVIPLLTGGRTVTSARLKKALGWDKRVPISVVIERFQQVVAALVDFSSFQHLSSDLDKLIQELGSRLQALDGKAIQNLKTFTGGRNWVPTSGSTLSSTMYAVFNMDRSPPLFRRIKKSLKDNPNSKRFLICMGCIDKISGDVVVQTIQDNPDLKTEQKLAFLGWLGAETIAKCERPFIPDNSDVLRRLSEVYFDDMAGRSPVPELLKSKYPAHREMKPELARHLKLDFLGDLVTAADNTEEEDHESMGEPLTNRISKLLREYSKEQALLEFLANAADANATKFRICVDEFGGGQGNLITSKMDTFERAPSLIVYNDAEFKDKDWKGIRRIGTGSKQAQGDGEEDKIGRFGLGALSMFHFTEVAMIVSGRQVLFLDPTAQPGRIHGNKTLSGRLITLANMKQHFPGHLTSLDGVFGFSRNLESYPGTIFKLSLRTEEQAKRSLVSKIPFTADGIAALVSEFYKTHALSTLLFVRVKELSAHRRHKHQPTSEVWSFITSRSPIAKTSTTGTAEVVTVQHLAEGHLRSDETWHVISETGGLSCLPKEHQDEARNYDMKGISMGVAGRISDNRLDGRLFFGVPLLSSTDLPIHIHGSFILSNSRREVWSEGKGSRFNKWLMKNKISPLYLFLLSTWPAGRQLVGSPWWPKSSSSIPIIQCILDSMKEKYLSSQHLICENLAGARLTPNECLFFDLDPEVQVVRGVKKVLKLLRPHNLIPYPPTVVRPESLPTVDSAYLVEILRTSDNFVHLFSRQEIAISDIVEVVRFIRDEEVKLLQEMRLLPLANGQLGSFKRFGASPQVYFLPSHLKPNRWSDLFGGARFIHPQFDEETARSLFGSGLNVSELVSDPSAIVGLLEEILPRADEAEIGISQERQIESFWSLLEHVDIQRRAIESFPLVASGNSVQPRTYLSIRKCDGDCVFVPPSNGAPIPSQLLTQLGLRSVHKNDLPLKLKHFLPDLEFSLHKLLNHIASLPESSTELLANPGIAPWMRSQLASLPAVEDIFDPAREPSVSQSRDIGQHLPVWEALRLKNGEYHRGFASCSEITMVPPEINLASIKTWLQKDKNAVYASHSHALANAGAALLSTSELQQRLQFDIPPSFAVMGQYVDLLGALVDKSQLPTIPVLTAAGTFVDSDLIYSDAEPVYTAAFYSTEPHRFLHPRLRCLQAGLQNFGLKHQVTLRAFKAAAEAIARDFDNSVDVPNTLERARRIYQGFSTKLWSDIVHNWDTFFWRELAHIHFIPRAESRRRHQEATELQRYALDLQDLVAPEQVLAEKFESVAWTQKVLFWSEPSEQILMVYPTFGVPTVPEVIQHLRVLANQIAPDYPHHPVLIIDLFNTYEWLNQQNRAECLELLEYTPEALFLNVDDPTTEWTWHAATDLLFGAPPESVGKLDVKEFLSDFKNLLLASGAEEIKKVLVPDVPLQPAEGSLFALKASFEKMRKKDLFTDVTFLTKDGKELNAHRAFLSSQNDYFERILTRELIEPRESSLVIEYQDYEPGSLEAILDYLYTDFVPADTEMEVCKLLGILELAHISNFDLKNLYTLVETRLINRCMTPWTYSQLLEVATRLDNQGRLAVSCRKYKKLNRKLLDKHGHTSTVLAV